MNTTPLAPPATPAAPTAARRSAVFQGVPLWAIRFRATLLRAARFRGACASLAVIGLAALGPAQPAGAKPFWLRGAQSNESDFLPPDVAFRVAARVDGNLLHVRWVIADGYYLYRHKMEIRAESPDLVVAEPTFPQGTFRTDPYLGLQEIFLNEVEGTATFSRFDAGAHPIQIKVSYQGCAEAGLCYLPITKVIFPDTIPVNAPIPSHPWEGVAILGGGGAFLLAGLLLRKGRRLDVPAG